MFTLPREQLGRDAARLLQHRRLERFDFHDGRGK